jgi:SAM-dependent methyltransferase
MALPFADRSFDLVVLVATLEFVDDPGRAMRAASRAARVGLVVGALNRCSLLAIRRRASRKAPWDEAKFLSPRDLAAVVRNAAGERIRSTRCRTTLWPIPWLGSLPLPWGSFIGMAVELDPGKRKQQCYEFPLRSASIPCDSSASHRRSMTPWPSFVVATLTCSPDR